jgi:VanZ family protein
LARWWPAILWAILISVLSTGLFSSEHTSRIIVPLLQWLFPDASQESVLLIHHIIRKCGHVLEFFVLGLLILRGIRAGRREAHVAWALLAIAMVAGYAAFDEFHQSLTPGRGAMELSDVLLDTSGGAAAQAVAALIVLWQRRRKPLAAKQELP